MRQIKVKSGVSRYTLKGDDGTYIGELVIDYAPKEKTCGIDISKRGAEMKRMSIYSGRRR